MKIKEDCPSNLNLSKFFFSLRIKLSVLGFISLLTQMFHAIRKESALSVNSKGPYQVLKLHKYNLRLTI